jgi:hypothetical protein
VKYQLPWGDYAFCRNTPAQPDSQNCSCPKWQLRSATGSWFWRKKGIQSLPEALPSNPNVVQVDFASQTYDHLSGRGDVLQVFSSSENDAAVYSSPVWSGFPPPETPHVWSSFTTFNYHTSILHILALR